MEQNRPQHSHRPQRMADLIRQEIATFLVNGVKNDRIGFVTVTHVEMTPDLQTARVYYTSYGSEKQKSESAVGLKESSARIRGHLGKTLRTRFTPRLEFFVDEGLEHSYKIQELLGSISHSDSESAEVETH
jgi:ribosome-binding factor A